MTISIFSIYTCAAASVLMCNVGFQKGLQLRCTSVLDSTQNQNTLEVPGGKCFFIDAHLIYQRES